MVDLIIYTLIAILILNLLFSLLLEYLNARSRSNNLPDLLSGIYDQENYAKQQVYEKEKVQLGVLESILITIIIIAAIATQGFGVLHTFIQSISTSIILQTLLFFGSIGLISLILSFPFTYYSTFYIEEKYGFNKTTIKTFYFDILKTVFLSIIIGGTLIGVITWLYIFNPEIFWITTLAVIVLFSLIMNALYSSVILPLFNKKNPLDDGELKQKVVAFAESVGFSINNVYIIDGSKRTTKANAFFTGFGKRKSVFLYDNLTTNLTNDEVLAVIAHEIGHYKKHHIWLNLLIGLVQSAFFLYLFNMIAQNILFTKVLWGYADTTVFYLNILCFALLIEPLQLVLSILSNALSRRMEYEADHFATNYGFGQSLISALKKLSSLNYSNLTPHPLYVIVNYSHPTLTNRIVAILNSK